VHYCFLNADVYLIIVHSFENLRALLPLYHSYHTTVMHTCRSRPLIDNGGVGLLYTCIYIQNGVYFLHLTLPEVNFPPSQGFGRMYLNLVNY
jgi:hypothetical protein